MTIYARLTAEESDRLSLKLAAAAEKTRAEMTKLARTSKLTRDQLYGRDILEKYFDLYDELVGLVSESVLDHVLRSRLAAAS